MAITETRYEHVVLADDGAPIIAETTMKVAELVVAQQAYGWSPEELHFQFPHLTLGQIHSALAYYWDHQQRLDQEIVRRHSTAEQLRQESAHSALLQRLAGRSAR